MQGITPLARIIASWSCSGQRSYENHCRFSSVQVSVNGLIGISSWLWALGLSLLVWELAPGQLGLLHSGLEYESPVK